MKKRIVCMVLLVAITIASVAFSESPEYPDRIFDEPAYEYTVTEKEGLVIPVDLKGMPVQNIQHKAASDNFFLHYLDSAGLHILPIRAGKATVTLTNSLDKKDKTVITVIIDDSAVYAKGEESPLRAYIVPDETVYTGEKCSGKFVVLGGSGKYTFLEITGQAIGPGENYGLGGIRVNGKTKGTFTATLAAEMIRLRLAVMDSDNKMVLVYAPVIMFEKSMEVLPDTFCDALYPGEEIHMKYFIRGGTKPYNARIEFDGRGTKNLKAAEGENEFSAVIPDYADTLLFSVRDSKKNNYSQYIPVYHEAGAARAVRVDKPFARPGDEIFFTTVYGDRTGTGVTCSFSYMERDPEHFTYRKTAITNVTKTENGYMLKADRPGPICVDVYYDEIQFGTEDIMMVRVLDE